MTVLCAPFDLLVNSRAPLAHGLELNGMTRLAENTLASIRASDISHVRFTRP